MKNIILLMTFTIFIGLYCKSQQIFPMPSGESGKLTDITKEVSYSYSQIWPPVICQSSVITLLKKKKESSENRRFRFTANFSSNSWNNPNEDCGYSKLGRLAFKDSEKGGWNKYKVHLGWRSAKEEGKLWFALYFHNQDDEKWVWNKFAYGYVNEDIYVDMFLGKDILALIVDNKCIGIRYKNYIPEEIGKSALARTFFYGGSCCPPDNTMSVNFSNQLYDYSGYSFNSQDYMTWNLSEFVNGDKGKFYAKKLVNGSIKNPADVGSKVTITKQKCIIDAGADITFGSKERIVLHPGFHAKYGSYFRAAICNQIVIKSVPEKYEYPLCYTVENAESAVVSIYYQEWSGLEWEFIGSLTGTFIGNEVCFEPKAVLPPTGTYKLEATFTNKCMDIMSIELYEVINGKTVSSVDTLNKQSKIIDNYILNEKQSQFKNHKKRITLFPNPTQTGLFTLRFNDGVSKSYSVEVRNTTGNTVFRQDDVHDNAIAVDIRNKPKGLYIVKVTAGNKVFTEKVIVQ